MLPASEATGPCKARALAQALWEGEEFYLQARGGRALEPQAGVGRAGGQASGCDAAGPAGPAAQKRLRTFFDAHSSSSSYPGSAQIDSHMRFEAGWDVALLRMLRQAEAAAGHARVVLSHYPPGYEVRRVTWGVLGRATRAGVRAHAGPPAPVRCRRAPVPCRPRLQRLPLTSSLCALVLQGAGPNAVLPAVPLPTVLCASGWGQADGLLRVSGRKLQQPLAAPAPALFWAAGLSFSRAQLIQEASGLGQWAACCAGA